MKHWNDINILIVDDAADIRKILKIRLNREGYKTAGAGTIAQATEELKKKFYNIVLVDLKLPDGTGLELLRKIKKTKKGTLAIIFTGFASVENSISALNEGAVAYIQKPLNMDELKISIKKALAMQKLSFDNKNLVNKLKELSLKDTHTELYNYRYLMERLKSELKRAKKYALLLSVIMLDIDYFKSVNDVYGHYYGDIILKEFARFLKNFARDISIVTRYGCEKFVIILPNTNKEDAISFGKRLLAGIEKHRFDSEDRKIRLKTSIGIASFREDNFNGDTASGLLDSANNALLNAKALGGNRLATFKNIGKKGKGMEKRANQLVLESIYGFAKAVEAKDYYTLEHAENMVSIVTKIGKRLNLSNNAIEDLKHAATLHDLGKIGIPDDILLKKGKLSAQEYEIMKKHPQIGAEIIRPIHFLKGLVPVILYHHERFDGLGYPAGLKGKEIPIGARIVAVADVYQALISDRPYRKAYGRKESIKIIKERSGTHFDPEIVKAFLETV